MFTLNIHDRLVSLIFNIGLVMASSILSSLSWLDSDSASKNEPLPTTRPETEKGRWIPFIFLHCGCFLIPVVGCSRTAVMVCISLYVVRMFAITGFYHRYFSHRTFKTTRLAQFIFAVVGLSAIQRGPLWWAAHHRRHHRESDKDQDIHSPIARSFLWAHIGWITTSQNMATNYDAVHDFAKFPELRFLNRFDWIVPALLAAFLYWFGELAHNVSHTNTSGWQLIVWGFFLSTVLVFHATSSINSLSHIWGTRRYKTSDNSKNNFLLALITLGEGWHNNHHQYAHSTRQGFYWWEIDLTYYGLLALERLGLISDLLPVPPVVRDGNRKIALADTSSALGLIPVSNIAANVVFNAATQSSKSNIVPSTEALKSLVGEPL